MVRESYVTKKQYIGGRVSFVQSGAGSLQVTKKIGGRMVRISDAVRKVSKVEPDIEKVDKVTQERVYRQLAEKFASL